MSLWHFDWQEICQGCGRSYRPVETQYGRSQSKEHLGHVKNPAVRSLQASRDEWAEMAMAVEG